MPARAPGRNSHYMDLGRLLGQLSGTLAVE